MIMLPNFHKCVQFERLKEKMGVKIIPILPEVKFVREITEYEEVEVPNPDVEIEKRLQEGKIDVSFSDITPGPEGLLTYADRKVVAYIRDQSRGITPYSTKYRFHLCDCSTLQDMRHRGREARYFITKRKDSFFDVNDLSSGRTIKRTLQMNLCKNCIMELSNRRLYFEPFNLEEYFERYDSEVPKTIKKTISQTRTQNYTPDHNDIAREYKKAANHCCQFCGVNCSSNSSLLNLHHCDGDKSNNKHENLRVLCVDCHSRQPFHTQMTHTERTREQIRIVKKLRKVQEIPDLD